MHSFIHGHGEHSHETSGKTRGLVMNWGWSYDLMVWFSTRLLFGSSERAVRNTIADLAQLRAGEAVLDVGCGTGSLALVSKERVGETGRVCGIDPGVQQITRARHKAAHSGRAIDFQVGVIEQLAFPDQSFDVVLSTLMMHHLPDDLKRQGLAEIMRVLKLGGRLLVVDFNRRENAQGRTARLGAGEMGTGEIGIQGLPDLMKEAGFSQIESGDTKFRGLGFALARRG
jgi:ubiquinone/menaquinone biosynthesis C-methylase UbiE